MSSSPRAAAPRGRQRLPVDVRAGGHEAVAEEEEQWEEVNRLLRGQGLDAVRVQSARQHCSSAGDEVVLGACELRRTLQTLLRDAERRQHLIQDLVLTNNRLTADLRAQQARVRGAEERLQRLERAQERGGSGSLGVPRVPPPSPPMKERAPNRRPRAPEGGTPSYERRTIGTHTAARRQVEGEEEECPAGNGWKQEALTGAQGPAWGASRAVLAGLVSAVQQLFEVRSLDGVYPHLHAMYMRLGEMNNAVRTLRQLLSLDEAVPVGTVVDSVSRLCAAVGKRTSRQRHPLISPGSNSSRAWLELYEEFFPAFQQLVQQLKDTLGVDSLDSILPALQQLQAECRGRPSR